MLHIFNYSVKKLSNLEWSFLIIDSSWKNKTSIISTRTFRMVINLSKNCLQTQSFFFIVWNRKQMFFLLGKTGSRETKLLNFKRSSKTFTQHTNWKDKTPITSTETVRMVTNLSKPFPQIESIFIVSNQKQMIFVSRRP